MSPSAAKCACSSQNHLTTSLVVGSPVVSSSRVQLQSGSRRPRTGQGPRASRLAKTWKPVGSNLLISHGFDPARAVVPRRRPGGRPGRPEHVVARLAAAVDWQTRTGPGHGALKRAWLQLPAHDGDRTWTYPQVRSLQRRAIEIGYLVAHRERGHGRPLGGTITAAGIASLRDRDQWLLHHDALRAE